ncbi:MAG: DUF1772 domain-containing protein [Rhodothermales bacterium]
MELHAIALVLAAFLCSLVAGFLFAFAVVAMPGIKTLDDGAFIRAFQAMDGVIQNNQPLFMVVWLGSVVALIAAAVTGFGHLEGMARWGLIGTALVYLGGVQAPTVLINVPLNNRLQSLDVDALDASSRAAARAAFEGRWNRSNRFRTVVACLVALVLTGRFFWM